MAIFLLALALLLCAVPAAGAVPLLPDVVSDPPVGSDSDADGVVDPPEVYTDALGTRLLLRMDGFVHNAGAGALEIRGSNRTGLVMGTVHQRVYDSGGGFANVAHVPSPLVIYETSDGHNHWHTRSAMNYSLWSAGRTAESAAGQKVGFCMLDSEPVEAPAGDPPVYAGDDDGFCLYNRPTAPDITMGVSAGWRDIYPWYLAFQWVDISDVAPGRHWLRSDADPDGVLRESDEINVPAYAGEISTVNGYLAQPVAAGTLAQLGATTIALAAQRYDDPAPGSPGAREFTIVTPPAKGTLDRQAGTWFTSAQLTYTPSPGASGADSFTYAARDAASPFPLNPRAAAVTLIVSAPDRPDPGIGVLGISGAPPSVATSSQTQLSASGPGADQGVTWSVDGAAGGSGPAGTISPDGVYTAPASVPTAGSVVVGARSATGATGTARIEVVAAPEQRPAPTIPAPTVFRSSLSQLRLARHGRALIATVTAGRYGRVRFVARRNGRTIGGCATVVRRGTKATCSVRIPRSVARAALVCRIPRRIGLKLPGVTVTATLTVGGKVVALRRARAA